VGGEIRGSIQARTRVVLLSTGRLYGDIVTPSLIVEDGTVFQGRCTINTPATA
ncbi:MAG: polymer-forming cytoskeletal protein, partial [Leptospiraceae bacterium]|nr:polymer-forming cytoskeletal protein [Leptospiraceae bacterium]